MRQSQSRWNRDAEQRRLSASIAVRFRQGSTLLVVVALMGMLALLGVMFFAFASQEAENAKNFQKGATDPPAGLNPDIYFDWALRQLIEGTRKNENNSVFQGGHLSMIPNAYGHVRYIPSSTLPRLSDTHPHSGTGLRLSQNSTFTSGTLTNLSAPFVDMDGNGAPDLLDFDGDGNSNDLLWLNRSLAAHVVTGSPNVALRIPDDLYPEPDVDYTYPDVNNAFLAHIGYVPYQESDLNGDGNFDPAEDLNGNGGSSWDAVPYRIRVIKPSFWRPELLQRLETSTSNEDANGDGIFDPRPVADGGEDANGNGVWDVGDFNGDGSTDNIARLDPTWYWAPWAAARSLRPHPEHYFVPVDPIAVPPEVKRFLNENDPADQAVINRLPGGSRGFPFAGRRNSSGDIDSTTSLSPGVWGGVRQAAMPIRFDADADGDGIREAILMDLDFPVQQRSSDGAFYIPIYGMTIYDGDGLVNLNTAGNLSGNTSDPSPTGYFGDGAGALTGQPGQFKSISRSLQGVSPSEVNPAWALDTNPATTTLSGDYLEFFGRSPNDTSAPGDRWELASMEQWWLKKGRIEFEGSSTSLFHAGILGDVEKTTSGGFTNGLREVFDRAQALTIAPISLNNSTDTYLFPFPGKWYDDDNRDGNQGGSPAGNGGQSTPAVNPISFDGRGRFTMSGEPKNLQRFQITNNPTKFQSYPGFGLAGKVALLDREPDPSAIPIHHQLLPPGSGVTLGNNYERREAGPDDEFFTADDVLYLVDDFNEVILETRAISRPDDEPLKPNSAGILHLSKTDIDNAVDSSKISNRIQELMPANINPNDNSLEANERRRRFTPLSWDLKQYSFPRMLVPVGAPGETGVDDNGDGVVDDRGEIGWPGTNDLRAWEFSADVDDDRFVAGTDTGRSEFPPAGFNLSAPANQQIWEYEGFHPGLPSNPRPPHPDVADPLNIYAPDPFRPQLRRLLETEFRNTNETKLQSRLNLNLLLDVVRPPGGSATPFFDAAGIWTGELEYRALTDHANNTALTTITTILAPWTTPVPNFPPTNDADREFWARHDRQRMARDIYVMLYMLCGGTDSFDYRTNTGGPFGGAAYSAVQKRQMAQFAVNMVDSVDRDNVMTMFEYDTDLSDGWGLDDQPWDDAEDLDAADRAVVFGVEAQELAFSEWLWIHHDPSTLSADHAATIYTDDDPNLGELHFLYLELQNLSSKQVDLHGGSSSTNHAGAAWRIRRIDSNDNDVDGVSQELHTNAVAAGNDAVYFKNSTNNELDPGETFVIANADKYDSNGTSDLYIERAPSSGNYELVAPYNPGVFITGFTGSTTAQSDLDLAHAASTEFGLVNGTSTGEFLDDSLTLTSPMRQTFTLERRLNPAQPLLPVTMNPWITVDAVIVNRSEFNLLDTETTATSIDSRLQSDVESLVRDEPLNADMSAERTSPGNGSDPFHNSLGRDRGNFIGENPHTIIQTHHDRDFVSSIELMTVPLYGPGYQTRASSRYNLSPYDQWLDTGAANDEGPFTAAAMFLMPSPPNQSGGGGPGTFPGQGVGPPRLPPGFVRRQRFKNHWHRLLEFVEVPTRTHLHPQFGGPFGTNRVPGRINLNTARHPEVLAALLDDPELFRPPNVGANRFGLLGNVSVEPGSPVSSMNENDASRDWWTDFLWSRDGLHPETNLMLPGMPYSKPFRSLGTITNNANVAAATSVVPVDGSAVEDSILRAHPDQASSRGLFDLGTAAEANSNNLNHFNRRRILSKIIGNSTTRSNVFYVFVHVQFHEVHKHIDISGNDHYRVAGRIDLNDDGNTDDGHRGFFVIDRSDAMEAYDSETGKIDWKHLVKHRLTIN
jgi:hypothetical protein